MRVLSVGNRYPPAATGGYERIFAATVEALRRAGHDVRVLTTAGGDPTPGVARELAWYWRDGAFPDRPLAARARLERRNAVVLRRHLREHDPDVVAWWGMGGMSLSLIEQVRRARIPAVGVVADGWMVYGLQADGWTHAWRRHPRLAGLAERLARVPARLDLGAGAEWLFISEAARSRALAEGHVLPRTALAHPGVDPARFPPAPARPWGWRLACIGRVESRKGAAVAVEALAALPEATLTIDGPDEAGHRAELEALADRVGVAGRVRFALTPADRVAAAYAAADAVLFPVTWPEPWGLVPLEAMSVGRPVVATGTGGSAEYLVDCDNALLVAPRDAGALAAAVRRLAADAALRERIVSSGHRTAARFTQSAFESTVLAHLGAARNRSVRGHTDE